MEPVDGLIKECRGLRRFLLRGVEKVKGERHLIAITHNLLGLFRYSRSQQQELVNTIFNDYGNHSSIINTSVAGTTFSASTRLG